MNKRMLSQSNVRRIIALLLILALQLGAFLMPAYAADSGETLPPEETTAPAATEIPTETEIPGETEVPPETEVPVLEGGDDPSQAPSSGGMSDAPLTLEDFGINFQAMLYANGGTPSYLNPQTLVVSADNENNAHTGSADGDLHNYLFAEDRPAPIEVRFNIETMPVRNAYLAIHAWDCDETSTSLPEYDAVYVNGVKVGVMTGQNNEWNTTLLAVPISALREGANYVTIHIGAKDLSTGEIYEYYENRWAIEVKWVQLLLDGGANESKPEEFYLTLRNAYSSGRTVYCEAAVDINSNKNRTYEVEYNLVDRSSPSSSSYLQIISTDFDRVSGTSIQTAGTLSLPLDSLTGEYSVQVLLKDPATAEILAVDEAYFDFTTGKVPSFDVNSFKVTLTPLEYTSGPVTMQMQAQLKNVASLSGITFAVEGEPVNTKVDANGVATAEYQVKENGLYRVELLYTKDGEYHGAKQYITVDNILESDYFFEYSVNGGGYTQGTSAAVLDRDTISVRGFKRNPDGSASPIVSDGNPYKYTISGDVHQFKLNDDTVSFLFYRETQATVSVTDQDDNVMATFTINVDGARYSLSYLLNDDTDAITANRADLINEVDVMHLYAYARYDNGEGYLIDRNSNGYFFARENNLVNMNFGKFMEVTPNGTTPGNSGVVLQLHGHNVAVMDIEVLSLDQGKDLLLKETKDGKIPVDDSRMMDLVELYLEDEGLSSDRADQVVDAIEDAPYPYDELYVYSLFEYNIESTSASGSFFSHNTNGLNLGANTAPADFLNTWFHESGHAADWTAGNNDYRTRVQDVLRMLEDDLQPKINSQITTEVNKLLANKITPGSVTLSEDQVNQIVNNLLGPDNAPAPNFFGFTSDPDPSGLTGDTLKIYKRVRDALTKNLKTIAYSNAEMGSDVNGGLCNNTIRGGFGHRYPFLAGGDDYWFSGGAPTGLQCMEAWAEFFSAKMIGDTAAQARNASYFPETCAYFEELALTMLNELKDQY